MRLTVPLIAALVALPAAASAQATPDAERNSLTVGVGGALIPSYEGSDDYRLIPAGAVRGQLDGFKFQTYGTNLYVDLVREGPNDLDFALGPVIGLNLDRTGGIKDAQVRALGELDPALELGAYVGIGKTGVITSAYDTLSFSVAYQHGVTGAHDSYVVTPSLAYGTPLSERTYVGLSFDAEYVGDGYARTYFGVTPAGAAASGLPAYSLDGGFKNVSATLLAAQSLSGDLRRGWSAFAIGSYSRLLGKFADSPIVAQAGDADQWYGAVGVGYTF